MTDKLLCSPQPQAVGAGRTHTLPNRRAPAAECSVGCTAEEGKSVDALRRASVLTSHLYEQVQTTRAAQLSRQQHQIAMRASRCWLWSRRQTQASRVVAQEVASCQSHDGPLLPDVC